MFFIADTDIFTLLKPQMKDITVHFFPAVRRHFWLHGW